KPRGASCRLFPLLRHAAACERNTHGLQNSLSQFELSLVSLRSRLAGRNSRMKRLLSHALWLLLPNVCGLALAQSIGPWLHREVKENKTEPVLVKVNLPVSLVDVALDVVREESLRHGKFKLEHTEITVA